MVSGKENKVSFAVRSGCPYHVNILLFGISEVSPLGQFHCKNGSQWCPSRSDGEEYGVEFVLVVEERVHLIAGKHVTIVMVQDQRMIDLSR